MIFTAIATTAAVATAVTTAWSVYSALSDYCDKSKENNEECIKTNFARLFSDNRSDESPTENGMRLKDKDGNEFLLTKNQDGTETATYDDGRTVSFQRDENNHIHHTGGESSILPMLLGSYFLYHGFGSTTPNQYHYDSNTKTYVSEQPLQKMDENERRNRANSFLPAAAASYYRNTGDISTSSKGAASKSSVSNSAKGGFGGAGARSASS